MTDQRSEYTEESYRTLALLAERIEDNPKFMAHLLGQHRRQEGVSRETQQHLLGVDGIGIVRLALCHRPAGEPAGFRIQCEQIARYTGANLSALVQVIRRVDAVQSMELRDDLTQRTQESTAGQKVQAPVLRSMLAARDRLNESTQHYTPDKPEPESSQSNSADSAADPSVEEPRGTPLAMKRVLMTTQPAHPQSHRHNQTTQWLDTECSDLVRDFWAAAGGEEPFPRSLELALGFALPVTLVRLAGLHTEAARVWLRWRSRDVHFGDGSRPLHGCLIAFRGNGIIFLDASDNGDEQRFTLAHEIAHFLVDYMLPRRRMLAMLGSDFADVLDGTRAATTRERLASIFHGANTQPHVNLMLRGVAGSDAISIWSVEQRADRVALALLAPPERVLEIGQAESAVARRTAVENALVHSYGLPLVPAQRYAAELLQMQHSGDSWLSALRALVRTHDSHLIDEH